VGATTILNPAPAKQFDRELFDLVDILILNETELGLLTKTELRDTDDHSRFIEAARSLGIARDKAICVTLGKRGLVALIDGGHTLTMATPSKPSTAPAPAIVLSARSLHCSPTDSRFAAHSATPILRLQFACNEWAPPRRCRRSRKSRRSFVHLRQRGLKIEAKLMG
jgi:hypothetical protein